MEQHHTNDQHAPMNGDDDLAKALHDGLQFEETPMGGATPKSDATIMPSLPPLTPDAVNELPAPTLAPSPEDDDPAGMHRAKNHDADTLMLDPIDQPEAEVAEPAEELMDEPSVTSTTGNDDLDKLKASALEELRPLIGKLDLPAEEKFDTLLLIIRTTDDHTLLQEAHTAAKDISDDTRRAQALLDIVKEIDYFAGKR